MGSIEQVYRRKQFTRRKLLSRGLLGTVALGLSAAFVGVASTFKPRGEPLTSEVIKPPERNNEKRPRPTKVGAEGQRPGYFVAEFPIGLAEVAATVYPPGVVDGLRAGVAALSERCPVLATNTIAWCASSQWFECSHCGSTFNAVGERTGGPAPRGMTLLKVQLQGDGSLRVYRDQTIRGVPDPTDTLRQEAEGPLCVRGARWA